MRLNEKGRRATDLRLRSDAFIIRDERCAVALLAGAHVARATRGRSRRMAPGRTVVENLNLKVPRVYSSSVYLLVCGVRMIE